MVKLSEQLQQEPTRLTRTERVMQQQEEIRSEQKAREKKRLNKELETFEKEATFENYEQKYKSLSPTAKKYVLSPSELSQTPDYQNYIVQKREYEQAVAKQKEAEAYNRDLEIATKFANKGISSFALANPRQKRMWREIMEGRQLYKQKVLQPEKFTTDIDIYKKDPQLRQAVIEGKIKPEFSEEGTTDIRDDKLIFKEIKEIETKKPKEKTEIEVVEAKEKDIFAKAVGFLKEKGSQAVESFPYRLSITGTSIPKLTIEKKDESSAGQKAVKVLTKEAIPQSAMAFYESIPTKEIYVPSFLSVREGKISPSQVKEEALLTLTEYQEKQQKELMKKIDADKIEKDAQESYQKIFEEKYGEDIVEEKISFEKAREEFAGSDEAKLIQKNYETTVQNELADLGFEKEGYKIAGAEFLKTGVKYIPTTFKGAGVGVLGVYGGYKVLTAIPYKASLGITAGFGTYGTYKALSPTSTPTERASGSIIAGTSALTLGYAGYKYLKTPVIKTAPVKLKKPNLRTGDIIGKDINIATKKGALNRVIFPSQKLSQQVVSGRRTIVTTKGRELLRRGWIKLGVKPSIAENYIYRGIPTAQKTTTTVKGLGTTFTYQKSAYKDALNLLKKYGYTETQARATLRFYSPKITEQYLKSGIIRIKGGKAIGDFEYLTKQPAITVDKTLGIKTRGAKTIKDLYRVERKIVNLKSKSGVASVLEDKTRFTFTVDKAGRFADAKSVGFTRGWTVAKGSELRKGFEATKIKGVYSFEETPIRDIKGISTSRDLFPPRNIIRIDQLKTQLIQKQVDLTRQGIARTTGSKKTPFSKTFPKTQTDVQKVVNKLEQSQFSATPTKEIQQLQSGLKNVATPTRISATPVNLKDIIQISQTSNLALGQATTLASLSSLKEDQRFKLDLKLQNRFKDIEKEAEGEAVDETAGLKTSSGLKTGQSLKAQLKNILDTDITTTQQILRPPKPPEIPRISQPPTRPIPFGFLESRRSKQKTQDLSKLIYSRAYLPDFTSRALGLKPETISEKQAKKKLKQLLTGLEIRRGLVIK